MSSTLSQDIGQAPAMPETGMADEIVRPSTLRWMLVVALCAVLLGRAMAQALPGSRSGLGKWLDVSNGSAAFFTQLLAVLVVTVGGRLALITALDRHIDYRNRFLIAPAASAVIFLVIFASVDIAIGPFAPELSLLLGIAGAGVAVGAATVCAKPAFVRVGAIVLSLVAAASIAQVSARFLALQAGDAALPRQYLVSRWIATAAAAFDLGSLIIAALWIARRDRMRPVWLWLGMGLTLLIGIAAQRGATPTASFPEVLVSRLLAQMHREPSAMFPHLLQNCQEVLAILIALSLLRQPRSIRSELRSCLGMIVLARSSPDIPLCAGLLVTGALGLVTMVAHERPVAPG